VLLKEHAYIRTYVVVVDSIVIFNSSIHHHIIQINLANDLLSGEKLVMYPKSVVSRQ
jgi:hypothetical protein